MDTPHVYGSSVTLRQLHSRSRLFFTRAAMLLGAFALSSCVRSLCDGGGCEEVSFTGSLQPPASMTAVSASSSESSASAMPSSVDTAPSASGDAAVPAVACLGGEDCEGGFCSAEHVCVECESKSDCDLRGLKHCIVISGSPEQNRCVECLMDSDCDDDGTVCDGSGTCAPCDSVVRDGAFAGCESGQVCLAGATPVTNQCVECRNSGDCDGQLCEPLSHMCAPCIAATDTSAGAPDGSTPGDDGCGGNTTRCFSGLTPANNSCVQCLSNDDCADGFSQCDLGTHQCVACLSATDEAQTAQLDASAAAVSIDRGCDEVAPRCLIGNASEGGPTNVAPLGDSAVGDGGLNDASSESAVPGTSDLDDRHCVECVSEDDCAVTGVEGEARALCDLGRHTCVECVTSADCHSPGRAQCDSNGTCVPCDPAVHNENGVNADCLHIVGGMDVCVSGVCSECSGEFPAACGTDVCDDRPPASGAVSSTRFTCTTIEMRSGSACEECVSDAQCQPGQACVLTLFKETPMSDGYPVGYHCLYREVASSELPDGYDAAEQRDEYGVPDCVGDAAPYVNQQGSVSVSGKAGIFCTPATSTCAALADYRAVQCEAADDCGAPDVADATCSLWGQGQQLRCSPLCRSDDDCPRDANGNTFGCSGSGSCAFE